MMGEVIRVSGRTPDFGELLREAMVSQRFADVALCCSGGQRFLAHRLVLSAASPYLQEVLLAHGKAAGYCEPITIILAEVEGPELAAILSFVYTGSATVPRSRLEAFTRAAETLHVRIPPLIVPAFNIHQQYGDTRNVVNDCNLENVKIEETKIDSRYIRCEQYPSYDKWFNSSTWPFDGCLRHLQRGGIGEEWMLTEVDRISRSIDSSNDDVPREATFQREFVSWKDKMRLRDRENLTNCTWNNLSSSNSSSRINDGSCNLHVRVQPSTTIIPTVDHESRLDTFPADDNSVSRMSEEIAAVANTERDEAAKRLQHKDGDRQQGDNNDFEGRLVTESVPSLPLVHHHRTTGRSSVTFEKQDYDAVGANGNQVSISATVTSSVDANTKSATGRNDLTTAAMICGESCCRWRTPRRHVANRVPASPWCQLARPAHHSPKIQPIVLRNRKESNSSSETARHQWDETSSSTRNPFPATIYDVDESRETSTPLNLRRGITSTDCTGQLYSLQVPTVDISTSVDSSSRFVEYVDHRRTSPHFYDAPAYQTPVYPIATLPATLEQFSPRILSNEVVRIDVKSPPDACRGFDDSSISTRIRTTDECSNVSSLDDARGIICRHAISPEAKNQTANDPSTCNRRASPRIELSHPISRLCDTVSFNDDIGERQHCLMELNNSSDTTKLTATNTGCLDEKTKFFLSSGNVQSDDNNNEAGVGGVSRNVSAPFGACDKTAEGEGTSEDHRCEQCGKTFVTRASLKVHGRTHSGEKPFRCTDCGKEFSQLRNYKYHRSVHEGTREFAATCPECGKYFNDRGYLSSHMKIHRNRKEYACTECGKSFNQRVAYNMHVRIHTGVKPHQCEQCGKAFSRKMLLKQHLRTHSGERPYQCQICHKAFADRSNMTLHTRLHSGLKPYQCTLCSKAFTKKHHLKTHLNYHTGTKPYSCPNCALRFSQSSNMRTHYKKCAAGSSENSSYHSGVRDNGNNGSTTIIGVKTISNVDVAHEKTTSGSGRTSALTPPSSDQESSILTPMSEDRSTKSNPEYPAIEIRDTGNSVPNT